MGLMGIMGMERGKGVVGWVLDTGSEHDDSEYGGGGFRNRAVGQQGSR